MHMQSLHFIILGCISNEVMCGSGECILDKLTTTSVMMLRTVRMEVMRRIVQANLVRNGASLN